MEVVGAEARARVASESSTDAYSKSGVVVSQLLFPLATKARIEQDVHGANIANVAGEIVGGAVDFSTTAVATIIGTASATALTPIGGVAVGLAVKKGLDIPANAIADGAQWLFSSRSERQSNREKRLAARASH